MFQPATLAMISKYFNLKKVGKHLVSDNQSINPSGRRKFMKAMGLGAIAWNPVMDSITSLTSQPFEFSTASNNFRIYRNGAVVWTIDKSLFENGYSVKVRKNGEDYAISAKGIRIIHTNISLDFDARIQNNSGQWAMDISFSELGLNQKVNFIRFLDGLENLESGKYFQTNLIQLNSSHSIGIDGEVKLSISNSWELRFKGKDAVFSHIDGRCYISDELVLCTHKKNSIGFLNSNPVKGVQVLIPKDKSWGQFISRLLYNGENQLHVNGDKPTINYLLGKDRNGEDIKVKWVTQQNGNLTYKADENENTGFVFRNYIYLSEFKGGGIPEFYLSGKLNGENYWISNELGSFSFMGDSEAPELIASGAGTIIFEQIFEPRLRAFKPVVNGAVSLTSSFQDPPKVSLSTQGRIKTATRDTTKKAKLNIKNIPKSVKLPDKGSTRPSDSGPTRPKTEDTGRTQEPIKDISIQRQQPKIQRNTPKLSVEFDKVKFNPKRALKIKLLRPEDMVLLEFEFHNFNFTNKGEAPFVELDNPKKKGVVIIFFQTQHTLEEAFYESNQIPGVGSSDKVILPARHLRARKSRLVYELNEGHEGFPLIMDELLDWSKFNLRVHPRAWIKLENLVKLAIPGYLKSKTKLPNRNTQYLDTNSKDYAIKLTQVNKVSASKNIVYSESQLSKVLAVESVQTLKPSFKISSIKKISLNVAPIDSMSTSIEAPALMYISPNQVNDFFHKKKLEFRGIDEKKIIAQHLISDMRVFDPLVTTKGEIAELWHTKLGVKLKNGQTSNSIEKLKTIRALWAHDATTNYMDQGVRNAPFMSSLDANNRQKLVHTTSNYGIKDYYPAPVPVKNLMLTTLGAYLDWHAFFDVPNPADTYLNIIEWEHLATLGRDHFVKIVEEGYLFPFGHRAAIVTITERKFHKETKSAVNRQRKFIVVLEKEVIYDRNDPDNKFIEFPFQEVRIETTQTPNIDNPEESTLTDVPPNPKSKRNDNKIRFALPGGNTTYNFLINVNQKGFLFDLVLIDKDGLKHHIRMPLGFMENYIARKEGLMEKVIEKYHKNEYKSYNDIYFFGQEVAYAESLVDGDTAFETDTLLFGAQIFPAKGEGDLKFHPKMRSSKVYLKQVEEMTGIRELAEITLEDDNNQGQVFAKVKDAVVDFSGGSEKSGGFLSPNMAITALSKLQGPVGGNISDLKNLVFNPDDFFAALEEFPVAKIFGVIKIFDLLLGGLDLSGSFDGLKNKVNSVKQEIEDIKNEILYLENLAKETLQNVENQVNNKKQEIAAKVDELLAALNGNIPKIPNLKTYATELAFYAEYKWQPEFKSNPIKIIDGLLHVKVTDKNKALTITTKFEKPFDADKPAVLKGSARFEHFEIDIVPLLSVKFNYLEFKSGSSEKTDVKVDIDKNDPIKFKGALSFVNNLQSIIPSTGFSDDGPYIDISPTGVKVGFDISIPNVEVGVCMISNISLGACVTLPFTGAPLTLGFNFCKRENPFLLTISCFGGGGYFLMVTTLEGIQSMEAAFEFGAAVSLNVGVASGGVSIMGGFYFKLTKVTQTVIVKGEEEEIEVNQVDLAGYIRINGHLSILGLISVSLEFYLALEARFVGEKVEKMEGVATLKVKVEVLFFSKTVSVTVRRQLKGADADPKFIEMVDTEDWQEYCLAFAS